MDINSGQEVLESIGFTNIEAKAYLELLVLGPSTAGTLIKNLGLHRATIYSVLQRLISKGLISYSVKSGKRLFSPINPESLLDMVKERENNLKKIMPKLKARQEMAKEKQTAEIYEGAKGMKSVFDGFLRKMKKGDEYLVFGASEQVLLKNYLLSWHKKRSKMGVKLKIIFGEEKEKIRSHLIAKNSLTDMKYIPKEYTTPASINILRDKTGIFLWERDPLAFVINSKEVAESFRKYFNLMWNQDVKVYKGFDQVMSKFASALDMVKKGEEYLVLGANVGNERYRDKLLNWFLGYHTKRVRSGKKMRMLYSSAIRKEITNEHKRLGDLYERYTKIKELPEEFSSPMQINLYKGNKVLMFMWGREPVCFEIESETVYQNFKTYFDILWEQETRTYRGVKTIKTLFNDVVLSMDKGKRWKIFTVGKNPENTNKFFREMHKKRANLGIRSQIILSEDIKEEAILRSRIPLTECRLLPKSFAAPSVVNICGDTIILNFMTTEKKPIAYKMEDSKTVAMYKEYFNMLWNMAKK